MNKFIDFVFNFGKLEYYKCSNDINKEKCCFFFLFIGLFIELVMDCWIYDMSCLYCLELFFGDMKYGCVYCGK